MSKALDAAVQAIRYIRANDCDFITVDTVRDYSGASEVEARAAVRHEMGMDCYQAMVAEELRERGWDVIRNQIFVELPDRPPVCGRRRAALDASA